MKHCVLGLIFTLVIISSCRKIDKSSLNEPCTGSCATVSGRFMTSNNQPLPNIPIEIRSERSRPNYIVDVRRIATTKTDANGYYSMQFALKDYEWGPQASASVSLSYSYDESKYLPIHKFYKDIRLSYDGARFERSDVSVTKNIRLPKLTKVNLTLSGFVPPLDWANNYFNVAAFNKAGADAKELAVSGCLADAPITTKEIYVGGDDSTRFSIERRKAGVVSIKDTMVYTPIGKTTALSFSF